MSKFTAIKRKALSAPMKWLHEQGQLIGRTLDYGCGRGFDADHLGLEGYDPFWRPEFPTGKFRTITCIYVLNVLSPIESNDVIAKVKSLLHDDGFAFFVVRRDVKGSKKGRGCVQREVKLTMPSLRKTNNYEIYLWNISLDDE